MESADLGQPLGTWAGLSGRAWLAAQSARPLALHDPRTLAGGWTRSLPGTVAGSLRGELTCAPWPASTPEPPVRHPDYTRQRNPKDWLAQPPLAPGRRPVGPAMWEPGTTMSGASGTDIRR